MDRYENPSQLDHSSTHRQVALPEDPNISIIKQHSMALQQEHPPNRPLASHKTKVESYKDHSQVALYENPNSIKFAKDSSKLALLSLQ